MKAILLAATAMLTLAACADTTPTAVGRHPDAPPQPRFTYVPQPGTRWSIFTNVPAPESTLDATPGWEVATRFSTSAPGCVVGFRFYRAVGETGTNSIKLWTNSGTPLRQKTVTATGSGWKTVMLLKTAFVDQTVCLDVDTYYRVSVNTNTAQVKTFNYMYNGPIINGPLTADLSYYGQPTGAMPTQGSYSTFYVDVIFEEAAEL